MMEIFQKIAIVGRIPPPYGGVSVHIQRFIKILSKIGIPFVFFDLNSGGRAKFANAFITKTNLFPFIFFFPYRAFHFHTSKVNTILIISFLFNIRKKSKLIFSLHNQTPIYKYRNSGVFYRKLLRLIIKRVDCFVVTNINLRSWIIEELKMPNIPVLVSPAFLPVTEEEVRFFDYPNYVKQLFMDHAIVIGSQGFFGNFHEGNHVYCFDMIAKLLHRIRKEIPEVGGFTAVSGAYSKEHRAEILQMRLEFGLENHWVFFEESCPVVALYRKCSLFVRPTLTDGDSVSIRECLQMEIPVLASDCVPRPEGVHTFPTKDQDAFEKQALLILSSQS